MSGVPRGFAFVTFIDEKSALSSLNQKEHTLEGKKIEIKKAVPRNEVSPAKRITKKMFVGGIHPKVEDEELSKYFQQFGTVKSIQIMRDKTNGKSRGFGFVTFNDIETARKVEAKKNHVLRKKVC